MPGEPSRLSSDVHVCSKVLGMEITMDPNLLCVIVEIRSVFCLRFQVLVEQTSGSPVERERRSSHLAEFGLERIRVTGEEVAKCIVENG